MNYSIEEIASLIQAKSQISLPGTTVRCLLTDSRNLLVPESTLFFALKSQSNNGHRYIEDLYRRGVRNFAVTENSPQLDEMMRHAQANFLMVRDALGALQTLAADCRLRFQAPVLAIAGSNGKTIVKEWIWQLLREDFRISRSPGSFNSQVGVPLSLSMMEDDSRLAVIEAGISQPGEMDTLRDIVRPDWGLFTHLGPAHQENFESLESKLDEKLKLFEKCKVLVYCADDETVAARVEKLPASVRRFAWTAGQKEAAVSFRLDRFDTHTLITTFWKGYNRVFRLEFIDEASVENALHCLALLRMMEQEGNIRIDPNVVASRMLQLEPVAMRLEVKEGRHSCVLINDTYNSDIQALELALEFQARRLPSEGMQRSLILSDIYQSGQTDEQLYECVADLVRKHQIGRFIGIGQKLAAHSDKFPVTARFFLTTEDFLASPLADTMYNELILIKGSRRFGFERISERLALKSHTTELEVNLDAIVHNLKYFRSLIKPGTRLVAMVKAEAYGLGAVEVSKTLQAHACDVLAVAVADEGVRLRNAGISIPIMVMNPETGIFPLCSRYNLEPEIYSFKLLADFIQAGERLGIQSYPVHIKLDTGMHRLGFSEEDLPQLIDILHHQNVLRVATIFSHLAGSDEDTFDDYTQTQWELFNRMSETIREAMPYKILRHILNSAGIERFPQWQCDQVRLGIGLYGISVAHPEALRPVAALRTKILQIHDFKEGDTIGYSRTTRLTRNSRIATLPVGYADGLNRHNRGCEVLVNGHRAPIMGNICMDVCMIDVTGIQAEEGDKVVIFGEGLSISEVASRIGTIPYEVLTSVSQRVKRVYFQD